MLTWGYTSPENLKNLKNINYLQNFTVYKKTRVYYTLLDFREEARAIMENTKKQATQWGSVSHPVGEILAPPLYSTFTF